MRSILHMSQITSLYIHCIELCKMHWHSKYIPNTFQVSSNYIPARNIPYTVKRILSGYQQYTVKRILSGYQQYTNKTTKNQLKPILYPHPHPINKPLSHTSTPHPPPPHKHTHMNAQSHALVFQ